MTGDESLDRRGCKLLAFAKEKAQTAPTWIDLHNAVFGIGGKYVQLFPTPAERGAFGKTEAYKVIMQLLDSLRAAKGDPQPLADRLANAQGHLSVRMPKSLHAALLAEAETEGVSLNQLCVAKLAVQLRSAV